MDFVSTSVATPSEVGTVCVGQAIPLTEETVTVSVLGNAIFMHIIDLVYLLLSKSAACYSILYFQVTTTNILLIYMYYVYMAH